MGTEQGGTIKKPMYFVPSWPVAVRNKIHVSIPVSCEKGQGIQTFRKPFSVRLNVCEKMNPVLHATERPFGKVYETRLAERDVLLLLKSPSTACKTEEAADPVTVTSPATPVNPNTCSVPSPCGHKCEVSADTEPALGHLVLLPAKPSKGMFTGVRVSVGLCFWGHRNPKFPSPEGSKYPLKPINCISTSWLLHTYSHTALGNKTASNTGLQTQFFGFRKKLISPWNDFVLLCAKYLFFSF